MLVVRFLSPADEPQVERGFYTLSTESRRLRYGLPLVDESGAMAPRMAPYSRIYGNLVEEAALPGAARIRLASGGSLGRIAAASCAEPLGS